MSKIGRKMEYITGMYALNMPCPSLKTCGDWHWKALNWKKLHIKNTDNNIFGDYGIMNLCLKNTD